jgi:hypothetical protein
VSDQEHLAAITELADRLAVAMTAAQAAGLDVDVFFDQTDVEITHFAQPSRARIFKRDTVAEVRMARPVQAPDN